MGAKTELGEDESICYYENDRITSIIAVIWRVWSSISYGVQRVAQTADRAFLFVDFEVFDFFVERVAIDAKLNGSLGSRTAASSQNLLNELSLDTIDDFAVQVPVFVGQFT